MIYIGIDIGKNQHYFAVTNSEGEMLVKPTSFQNNSAGFNLLLESIKPFQRARHLAGYESTGHYGDNLGRFLLNKGFEVGIINPLTTDAFRKQRIRKTKNDSIDALLICSVLESRQYTTLTKKKLILREGKQLSRYRQELVKQLNMTKNQFQADIDLAFPEFNTIFKTKYSKTYMAVVKEFPSANAIANAHLTKLSNVISDSSRGRLDKTFAKQLKEVAKHSIGEISATLEFKLKQHIEQIELIAEQVASVNEKIEELATQLNSPIFTIPGIGIITGFAILCEIQDIEAFSSSKKLIAFAGCDPATYQSGEYNAPTTAISKRGSPHLRLALYQAALPASRFNSTFKSYYNLKREQGKGHRCAQGHLVRKILRVIYKLLTENTSFDPALCV